MRDCRLVVAAPPSRGGLDDRGSTQPKRTEVDIATIESATEIGRRSFNFEVTDDELVDLRRRIAATHRDGGIAARGTGSRS